jgi:osmotically-inducible protein OsmY
MNLLINRRAILVGIVALSAQLISGCFPIVAGGMAGGAMVAADRRSPGVQAIDRGIQLETESSLIKAYGDNAHINASVFNHRVLLTGETRTEELKAEIEQKVKNMKNVKEVVNELVAAPLSGFSARANDTYLTTRVKSAFIANEGVPSNSMRIVTEASKVYLMGIVTDAEANKAVEIARQISGVKQVTKVFDIISESDKRRLDGQNKQ